MEHEALLKQLVELTEKPEVADKIKAVSSMEEMHALLRENGLETDDETLDELLATVSHFSENKGELNDDELEAVSGGVLPWSRHTPEQHNWLRTIQFLHRVMSAWSH